MRLLVCSEALATYPTKSNNLEFLADKIPMAGSETVRRLALALSNASERASYGTPAFFVKRRLFARLLEDGDSVVVRIELAERDRRMAADPSAFFLTDHYRKYPMMIVRLSAVSDDDLQELLEDAWKLVT